MRNVGMSTLFCSCCLDDKKLVRVVDVCWNFSWQDNLLQEVTSIWRVQTFFFKEKNTYSYTRHTTLYYYLICCLSFYRDLIKRTAEADSNS